MKKVLIPVDETKGSVDTLNVFRNMVRPPEEVILLHVSKPGGKSLMYDMLGEAELSTFKEAIKDSEYKETMDKKAEKILSFYKKELSRDGLINVRTIAKEGNPVDEILKTAAEEGAELVILGCNGKSKLEKFISGCVTKDVEKSSMVPVLVAISAGCDKSCEESFVLKEAEAHGG